MKSWQILLIVLALTIGSFLIFFYTNYEPILIFAGGMLGCFLWNSIFWLIGSVNLNDFNW